MENLNLSPRLSKITLVIVGTISLVVVIILAAPMFERSENKNPLINRNRLSVQKQERIEGGKLKNEIDCSESFFDVNALPLDAIKEEIYRRNFLAGFYGDSTPFFDTVSSAQCFDLNKNGREEVFLKIKVADLKDKNDKKDIGDRIINVVNAGAPKVEYILLIFMEKASDENKWNILWSGEFNNTEKDNELVVENGKRENSIKVGSYYLALDGEVPRVDINGEFKDVDANQKKFGEFPGRESSFGNYYTEAVFGEVNTKDNSFTSATRVWKKEGKVYKFITDMPITERYGNMDFVLLSVFPAEEGGDILYFKNVPGDTFCSVGLTRLDIKNNKISFPAFSRSYRSCNPSASPDGRKVFTVDAYDVSFYDLFNEKKYSVESWDGELTANKIYKGGREFEGNYGWLNNDTFFYDIFEEIGEGVENKYIETRVWKITDKGGIVKVKVADRNKEKIVAER